MRCKAIMSLVLVGILTNAMYAETPDEEIARLKKENELLELQKKNEELKKAKALNLRNLLVWIKAELLDSVKESMPILGAL